MRLGNIMVRRVITVGRSEAITNAARRMREANVGCLVIAEEKCVEGIVTDRDFVVGCVGAGHNLQQCQVSQHMSNPVITAEPTLDVTDACRLMTHKRVRRLPVVQDGKLVGLVSRSDIARALDQTMQDVLTGVGATWLSESDELSWLFDVKPAHMRGY